MNGRLPVCGLALLSALTAMPSSLAAQVAGAEITGTITDEAGAPVPGATVTVTNTATGRQRAVISTTDGIYATSGLAPGEYITEVTLTGFKAARRAASARAASSSRRRTSCTT